MPQIPRANVSATNMNAWHD